MLIHACAYAPQFGRRGPLCEIAPVFGAGSWFATPSAVVDCDECLCLAALALATPATRCPYCRWPIDDCADRRDRGIGTCATRNQPAPTSPVQNDIGEWWFLNSAGEWERFARGGSVERGEGAVISLDDKATRAHHASMSTRGTDKSRRYLSRSIRERVFSRDSYCCRKCAACSPTGQGLDVHHIVEVVYGGSDDESNLDTLCSACHAEWTWCGIDDAIEYESWRTLLPARVIVPLMAGRFSRTMTAGDFLSCTEVAFAQLRAKQIDEADWSPVIDKWTPKRPRTQKR